MEKQVEQTQLALRAKQIAGPKGILPISLASWHAGVAAKRYPQPIKLSPRVTVWRRDEVMALLVPATGGC